MFQRLLLMTFALLLPQASYGMEEETLTSSLGRIAQQQKNLGAYAQSETTHTLEDADPILVNTTGLIEVAFTQVLSDLKKDMTEGAINPYWLGKICHKVQAEEKTYRKALESSCPLSAVDMIFSDKSSDDVLASLSKINVTMGEIKGMRQTLSQKKRQCLTRHLEKYRKNHRLSENAVNMLERGPLPQTNMMERLDTLYGQIIENHSDTIVALHRIQPAADGESATEKMDFSDRCGISLMTYASHDDEGQWVSRTNIPPYNFLKGLFKTWDANPQVSADNYSLLCKGLTKRAEDLECQNELFQKISALSLEEKQDMLRLLNKETLY